MCVLLLAIRYWPRAPLAESFPTSRAIYDIHGRLLRLTLSADDKYRLWTPLSAMSGEFTEAVLLHEDKHFYLHPGVNPAALLRAGLRTYTGGARQGGSTITMQLARLIYRLNTRSPWGKARQIARAVELELLYSKAQILEAYLNLAPYGQNIEGVGAASLIYFNRVPQRLGLAEALTLAVIPQSPSRRALKDDEKKTLIDARNRLYAQWVAAASRGVRPGRAGALADEPPQHRGPAVSRAASRRHAARGSHVRRGGQHDQLDARPEAPADAGAPAAELCRARTAGGDSQCQRDAARYRAT